MDGEARSSRALLRSWLEARRGVLARLGIAAVLGAAYAHGRAFIADTAPYVQHIDERTLMRGARRVLTEDGLNPRIYNYPSLPFYSRLPVSPGAIKASGRGPDHVTVRAWVGSSLPTTSVLRWEWARGHCGCSWR